MSKNPSASHLARCGLIAAVYTVLCLTLAPISYGPIQIRVAEALTLLPVFGGEYILGVVLGCLLANALGSTAVDVVFGTTATLLACLCTWLLRHRRIRGLALPAALPPVLFNAVIIGLEIVFFFTEGAATLPGFLWAALTVGIGQVISCCILGVGLVYLIEHNPALRRIFCP